MSQQDFYTAWGEYIDNSVPTITTAAPTAAKTAAPTTIAPTVKPTATIAPTSKPTAAPTAAKTIVPKSDKYASVKPTATPCTGNAC